MIEIKNKKAYFDYYILEEFEAGIVLSGTEIKSIRKGSVDLKDTFINIKNNEAYLLNILLNMKREIFLIMMKEEPENYYYIKKKS